MGWYKEYILMNQIMKALAISIYKVINHIIFLLRQKKTNLLKPFVQIFLQLKKVYSMKIKVLIIISVAQLPKIKNLVSGYLKKVSRYLLKESLIQFIMPV